MVKRTSRWLAAACTALLLAVGLVAVEPPAPSVAASTATLSLYKAIENLGTGASEGDRGKWDVQARNVETGEVIRAQGLNGFQTRVIPSGTYVISELPNDRTPPGYRFRDWSCNGTLFAEPNPTITLADGQNLTCTVTNVAVQPTLTLRKVVEGGSAPPSLWTLRALDGPTNVSGPGNSPSVTNQPVRLGTYRLIEEGGPGAEQGYTGSGWSCTWEDHLGNTGELPVDASSRITIGLDRAVTCAITNRSELPTLTLVKEVVSPDGPAHPVDSWTLSATTAAGDGISGTSGSPEVSHVAVTPGVEHTLAESGPAGYATSPWSCTETSGEDDFVQDGDGVTLGPGAHVTCTVTNTFTGGWLTLDKVVVDSDRPAQSWTLSAAGTSGDASGTTIAGVADSPDVTAVPVPAGAYRLVEDGPEGYETEGFVCQDGAAGYEVTVTAGAQVSCTITNVREGGLTHLTLVKEVDNTGGGPFSRTAWGLRAQGPVTISGRTGLTPVTYAIVVPGTYTLSEGPAIADPNGDFARYTLEGWTCVETTEGELPLTGASSNQVDIIAGMQVTCTVRNEWTGASISFAKQVINAPFGTSEPGEWDLEIQDLDGSTVLAGDGSGSADTGIYQERIEPGTYRLVELEGSDGYEGPFFRCIGDADGVPDDELVTVPEGAVVSCTATNRAIPPTVTLVKELDNSGGGTETVDDFTLKTRGPGNAALSAPSGDPSVTGVTLPPGEYVFSEDGPAGYAVDWECVGASGWDDDAEVAVLGVGDDMVCTAYNTVVRPTLTLVKTVAGGGPAAASDWTLTADGPGAPVSGVTGSEGVTAVPVDAGVYDLSEAPVPDAGERTQGYEAGTWSCTAGTLAGTELTLAPGQDATCTLENTWQGGTLTLVKEVDDGQLGAGGGQPEDWTLRAEGPVTVSGPGGSEQVVDQPVPAGSYVLSESVTGDPVDPDYRPGEWVCDGTGFVLTGGTPGEAVLDVEPGADVSCTLVNLYRPPHLTLVKDVTGGGPLGEPGDWTLSFTGDSSGEGVTGEDAVTGVAVGSGTYTLGEEPADAALNVGYEPGTWSCTGGEVSDNGDGTAGLELAPTDLDVVCTVTNVWTGSTLSLVKEVDDGGESPDEQGTPADWTLTAEGPTPLEGLSGGPEVTERFVLAGEYALSEELTGTADPEYLPAEWACSTGPGSSLELGAPGSGKAELSIASGANEEVVCTIVNQFRPPHLTLVKEVEGGGPLASPADWTLSVAGGDHEVDVSAPGGSPELEDHAVGGGVFTLSEAPSDPSAETTGYEAGTWTCDGGTLAQTEPGTATLTLAAGEDTDVTCTLVNTWTGSHVTLVKEVDPGSVPPAPANEPTDWTLSATGDDGELHVPGTGGAHLPPGTYALSEAPSPGAEVDPDYRPGAWTCTTAAGVALVTGEPGTGTLTIEPDADAEVTCTLENVFSPPHLTLVKEVTGGGPLASPADWELGFDNPDSGRSGTGTTGAAPVTGAPAGSGTVTLTDPPHPEYEPGEWTCTGAANQPSPTAGGSATLELTPADRDVTCTITNAWVAAELTLVKEVRDGGLTPGTPGTPGQWTLSAVGEGGELHVDGEGSGRLAAGEYTLSETPNAAVDPDYHPGTWSCTEGAALTPGDPGTATLGLEPGSTVRCTLANLYQPPHLTLVKEVDGGPLPATDDWTLEFVDEEGTVSGSGRTGDPEVTGVAVGAGTYTLRETPTDPSAPADGYETTGWRCDGENQALAGQDGAATVALTPEDRDVVCVVVNEWTGGTLTLAKEVVGGDASPSDWLLAAQGPTALDGTSGSPAVTAASVLAGDYALAETAAVSAESAGRYAAGEWTCTGGDLTGGTVTVTRGADVVCTVTNTYDPPLLTLVKDVVGGPAGPESWVLGASGPVEISGVTGDSRVTAVEVDPGRYRLAETAVAGEPTDGYAPDGWVCEGAAISGGVVTLDLGDDVTCTVTNTHEDAGSSPLLPEPPLTIARTGVDVRDGVVAALVVLLIGAAVLAATRARRGGAGPSGRP